MPDYLKGKIYIIGSKNSNKEYYQKKAQVTNLKTIKCECGFIGLKNHLKRHMKSINHKDKMKLLIL